MPPRPPIRKPSPGAIVIRHTHPKTGDPTNYKPFPYQTFLHMSRAFLRGIIGGYGSAKTTFGCIELVRLFLNHNGCRLLDVSPSYTMAERTTIEAYKDIFECTVPGRWNYHGQKHQFTVRGYKSILWIGSGDRPNSLKGPNITHARIDEPFIQDVEAYRQVRARLRYERGPLGLILTGTPEQLNWGYDLLYGDQASRDDKKEQLPRNILHVATDKNEALPKWYLDSLFETYDEIMIRAYFYGEFINFATRQAYYAFDPTVHVCPLEYDPSRRIYLAFDFNVEPFCVSIIQQDGDVDLIIDEIYIPRNGTTARACDAFLAKYKDHKAGVSICGDPTGGARSTQAKIGGYNNYAIIKEHLGGMSGFEDRHSTAPVPMINSINLMNGRFKNTKGESHVKIDRKCKYVIQDCERVQRTQNGEIDKRDESLTHFSDGLRYYEWQHRRGVSWRGF